jgi:sodium/bile acid cotransporter 7
MPRFLRKNWFFLGIALVVTAGILLSDLGTVLNPGSASSTGVIVLLFVISGLTLPSESIHRGIKDFKLHIYVQGFIFLFVPLSMVVLTLPLRGVFDPKVTAGLYALACLPTTISSCIVFTQITGGNTVGTMFNAALANIAGVVVSPLILSILLQGNEAVLLAGEMGRILGSLGLKMILPIAAGQAARVSVQALKRAAVEKKGVFRTVSNGLILLIIFFSISKAAGTPEFRSTLTRMGLPFLFLGGFHFYLLAAAYFGGRVIRLGRESLKSVIFTAPQKTVALGVPLMSAYFAGSPDILGVALLPVIFYHSFQLIVAGSIKSFPFFAPDRG